MKQILKNIYYNLDLPAHLYHELCHILMMCLFAPWINRIYWKQSYFKINYDPKKYQLYGNCTIIFNCNSMIVNMLISSAPIIGWVIGDVIALNACPILCIYFGIYITGSFNMSEQDIKSFKECYGLLRKSIANKSKRS